MVMMVLLKDACTCATPSATFLRTFLRTRCAALFAGAFAMGVSQSGLFLQRLCCLARALAGAGIGAGALATHRQATTMTETTIAADVHQTLDVHGGFAAQIAFDCELCDLVANFFQIRVRQILDLLGVLNTACFANLASACTSNTENGGEANFRMLLRRNINTSDTCHDGPLKLLQSALTLFVTWIRTDHADNALATDDFAVAANFLYRSRNFHFILLKTLTQFQAYLARKTRRARD